MKIAMARCIRTTLTLEDDVAVQIERLRRARDLSLKDIVNDALRRGLREMLDAPKKRKHIRTQAFHMGEPLINIDNVAEALAYLEAEGFK
jgi:adenine C2-methylase RlmN of 23S rRNA A2503 and tRNA A37